MSTSRAKVEETVLAVLAEILPDLPAEEITLDKNLAGLGADSVDRVEIISLVVHRLDRSDQISNLAQIPNLGALIEHFSEGSPG